MGAVRGAFAVGAMVVAVLFAGCMGQPNYPLPLTISTPDLSGGKLATALTCDGTGRSPAISWSTPHPGMLSMVVELIDSDAPRGKQVQWVAYMDGPYVDGPIPGNDSLASPPGASLQAGTNDLGTLGYSAPCPLHGSTHHYRLLVRAIDFPMGPGTNGGELPPGYTPAQIEAAINSHKGIGVVNQGEIDGTYTRP